MRNTENKQVICRYLLWTLQKTRGLTDLIDLRYDEKRGIVEAVTWRNGQMEKKKEINVEADSGIALIKDVIRALE